MVIEDISLVDGAKRVAQIVKDNLLLVGISTVGVRTVTGLIGFVLAVAGAVLGFGIGYGIIAILGTGVLGLSFWNWTWNIDLLYIHDGRERYQYVYIHCLSYLPVSVGTRSGEGADRRPAHSNCSSGTVSRSSELDIGPLNHRREVITWEEVDRLIDHLIPQFRREFTAMVMITRGGIVPGGMLADAMDITHILTAAVDFPAQIAAELRQGSEKAKLMVWPQFIQFPAEDKLRGRPTLIVDDVWGSGRTITAVKNRVSAAGAFPETCVLHFNPGRNMFAQVRPDYYAAVTDAFIVYPWEIDRGTDQVLLGDI